MKTNASLSIVEPEDVRLCEKLNYYATRTLELIAMSISGLNESPQWKESCEMLLKQIAEVDTTDGVGNQ